MNSTISRILCTFSTVFLFLSHGAFAQPFNDIISFGDSLTDVGNVALLTEPGVSPVIFGYYQETHFSDNIIWVETLANYLGLPARTPGRGNRTTLPPEINGNTWAWGGSEAASGTVQPAGVTEPIPNLLNEVEQYILSQPVDPNNLYTIWSGADNLLVGDKFGPKAAKKAVQTVKDSMKWLERAGAKNILIFNMPKLGDTPSAQSGGKTSIIAADIYTYFYNRDLLQALKDLVKSKNFKANIYFADIYTEFVHIVNIVESGETYVPGFFVPGPAVAINNVTNEGLIYFQTYGTFPSNYLFWDDVHPTTQGHQVVAGLALQSLLKPVSGKILNKIEVLLPCSK